MDPYFPFILKKPMKITSTYFLKSVIYFTLFLKIIFIEQQWIYVRKI